ncbi:hypothetical protein [Nostoc sp. MS1]|uniref:hypothetical protein n=1 Tax=Nostoc sp. MS1 TaxID=2764711 RepID=UPI001CC64D48|nr:hypothetical protein [Nostoc sp. MS1]
MSVNILSRKSSNKSRRKEGWIGQLHFSIDDCYVGVYLQTRREMAEIINSLKKRSATLGGTPSLIGNLAPR